MTQRRHHSSRRIRIWRKMVLEKTGGTIQILKRLKKPGFQASRTLSVETVVYIMSCGLPFSGHMFSQLYLELKWYRVLKAKSEIGRSVSQALQRIRHFPKYANSTRFCTGAYGEKVSEGSKILSHKNISPSSLIRVFEASRTGLTGQIRTEFVIMSVSHRSSHTSICCGRKRF
jgi:hypothetical protein